MKEKEKLEKHKRKYIHIPKKALWFLIGIPLLIHNIYLIVGGYSPLEKLAGLQLIFFICVMASFITNYENI